MKGQSPFYHRSPVGDPKHFFGRERELASIHVLRERFGEAWVTGTGQIQVVEFLDILPKVRVL